MIINCHAHVFAFPKIRVLNVDLTFTSAEEKIAQMDSLGVDKAVILPLNNAESPVEHQSAGEILYICEKYPGRFIPFCNIDPRLPRKPDLIKTAEFDYLLEQYKQLGFKGLGELTARLYWDEPCMLKLLESCQKVGFPVLFHTISPDVNNYGVLDELGLPRLEKVLKMFPDLKFIGHSPGFWSEIDGGVKAEEKNRYPKEPVSSDGAVVRLMRKYANLYADISAGSGLNALARDEQYAYKFIDEFQDKLLFGLDYNYFGKEQQHIQWLKTIQGHGKISSKVYEKIMWENANSILDLGL